MFTYLSSVADKFLSLSWDNLAWSWEKLIWAEGRCENPGGGIICPLDWNRVNESVKIWGGDPPPCLLVPTALLSSTNYSVFKRFSKQKKGQDSWVRNFKVVDSNQFLICTSKFAIWRKLASEKLRDVAFKILLRFKFLYSENLRSDIITVDEIMSVRTRVSNLIYNLDYNFIS